MTANQQSGAAAATAAVATTDAPSELRLARSLGYPKSWHVVRSLISDPTDDSAKRQIIQDRIFAGDPAENADLYYNHRAAFERAVTWQEEGGESGPWDDEGGQMLPKEAKYKKGDSVQVLFDGKWYNATITKVGEFTDDIRYTALYTKENEYQNGVTEDELRLRPQSAAKSKKAAAAGKKSRYTSKKRKRDAGDSDDQEGEEGDSKKSKRNDSSGEAAAKEEEEAEPEPEPEPEPEEPLVVFKEVKTDELAVGKRVLIDYRNTLYKATIRKIRNREGKETDYSVHYDGLKKSKVSWVPFSTVAALLDPNDEAYVVPAPTS